MCDRGYNLKLGEGLWGDEGWPWRCALRAIVFGEDRSNGIFESEFRKVPVGDICVG
jgi:hypothetical protein